MKRRTLDIIFSVGGLLVAGLLLALGVVFTTNANFANSYVKDQLSQQKITFKAGDKLTPEERQAACVVKYAGQPLTSGKQAECYANDFIALHVKETDGADGKTYAELGSAQTQLRTELAAAQKAGDTATATTLQGQLDDLTTVRETVFKGETLRGLLLTSYGFSEFGRKAEQAAMLAYLGAALMVALSIAGFVHAFRTPKDAAFAEPEHVSNDRNEPTDRQPTPV